MEMCTWAKSGQSKPWIRPATEIRLETFMGSYLVQKDSVSRPKPDLPGKGTLFLCWTWAHEIVCLKPQRKNTCLRVMPSQRLPEMSRRWNLSVHELLHHLILCYVFEPRLTSVLFSFMRQWSLFLKSNSSSPKWYKHVLQQGAFLHWQWTPAGESSYKVGSTHPRWRESQNISEKPVPRLLHSQEVGAQFPRTALGRRSHRRAVTEKRLQREAFQLVPQSLLAV